MTRTIQILTLALLVSGCRGMKDTPVALLAPSPIVVAPTPTPAPSGPPFTVALEITRPQQTNQNLLTWQALVTVTANPGVVSPPLPASVEVECGTGTAQRREGFFGQSSFTCTAPREGTFLTRATAHGTGGFSAQATSNVSIAPTMPPFNVALDTIGPGPVQDLGGGDKGRRVTYSVLVTPDSRLAQSYEFDFGDGVKSGEISNHTQSHVYSKAGSYTAIVSVKSTDGRHQKVSKIVDIAF